jgi:hypothetical protein
VSFTTKQLSKRTWRDYERFFSQGNGWDHCGCVHYQGVRTGRGSFTEQRDANLATKCDLLGRGLAHGILVYDGKEPVGWCQFGPQSELPIRDGSSRQRNLLPVDPQDDVWRVTCFCTLKEYREQRIAEVALEAGLRAIREAGGGVVKAYPVVTLPTDLELDALVREHGGEAPMVLARAKETYGATDVVAYDRRAFSVGGVFVHGLGPLWALVRRMAGALHPGTVSMFDAHGFSATDVIQPTSRKLPYSRLVMERTVRRSRTSGGASVRRRAR